MTSLINKARKPKFELHLKIYDLNNVPLVSGTSSVKWNLSHSIHAEHRGRTPKCPIANHRVEFGYSKVVGSVRISIDKNNNLTECPIEFEVVQEFSMVAGGMGGRDEKISLGVVKLNLSEYVEESEGLTRDSISFDRGHFRKRSSGTGTSPTSMPPVNSEEAEAEEGIVRRYLMQESKINSTLKIGILMIQLDGDKNFVAPPLKTAPVFGGIAGIMAGEQVEQDDAGQMPSIAKTRDASEVQDMYRRALAASWACNRDEWPADQCIEDIFSGGDGWKASLASGVKRGGGDNSGSLSSDEGMGGTLRPSDIRRMQGAHHQQQRHRRHHSGGSDHSVTTVTGRNGAGPIRSGHHLPRNGSRDGLQHHDGGMRSRSESLASLAPTMGSSDRGRDSGFKRAREVDESEVRDDMIAWRLPGTVI